MPVYNGEKYLRESIDSVLNQTFKDFEFIIINDGSKDNSLGIIKKYARKDKRIILINNPKNKGLQFSLNAGLKIAKGKYIARMDQDDISHTKRLEIQYDYLEKNPPIFLIGSSAIVIDENGNKLGVFKKYDNYKKIKKKLLKNNCIIHPLIMFRNEGVLYREKFKMSEDYDFYLRLLSDGKKITNLPDFLLKYRIDGSSLMSTTEDQQFYFQKAREFYLQRLNSKKDDYSKLEIPSILGKKKMPNFNKKKLKTKILVEFQDNQMKFVRKNIRLFIRDYGFDQRLFFYYLLSFLPYSLTKFIKDKFFL